MVLGELAQATADGRSDVGLDEIGQVFANRFVEVVSGRRAEAGAGHSQGSPPRGRNRALDRRAFAPADIDLEQAAAQADISPFHFLRLFSSVLGVTPHQYLVRSRLRHAARLLGRR